MSDYIQSYVFREKRFGNPSTFDRVTEWLIGEKIIDVEGTARPAGKGGYGPGARASSILNDKCYEWPSRLDTSVVFEVGRIIEASTELRFGCCPDCNNEFSVGSEAFLPVDAALDRYGRGGSGELLCPHCGRLGHLLNWNFGNGLAVGHAKVAFRNWPEHLPELDGRFFDLAGMWCTKVWGKL